VRELQIELLAWLSLAVPGAFLAVVLWAWWPPARRWLWPPQRRRAVPWQGTDVLLAIAVHIFFPLMVLAVLINSGFFPWLYGTPAPPTTPKTLTEHLTEQQKLWVPALALFLQVPAVLVFFRLTRNVRPYQLGLTTHRLAANVVAGYVAWLVCSLLAYGVLYLVQLFYLLLLRRLPEEQHPLTKLALEGHLMPAEWVLFLFDVVVAAPVWEELLFRGVLQPWFGQRSWGGEAAAAGAVAAALCFGASEVGPWPAVFVVLAAAAYPLVARLGRRWLPPREAARAIYGTALLFAAFHSFAWPTPIPLFVLGLGLGWLAYRTQSLIGPMVLHGLFNNVACVEQWLAR